MKCTNNQITDKSYFFNSGVAQNYFVWFNCITNGPKLSLGVENSVVRDSMGFKPIPLSVFSGYLYWLTPLVDHKLSELLPKQLALIFDG